MWCCSIRLGCAVFACAFLALAASVTRAQDRDETWVVAQIANGKFEELRSLEKLSEEGAPVAMYWWGVILERCIFERCDQQAARELILRAAVAGHSRARVHLLGSASTREEFDDLVAKIGEPSAGRERLAYVARALFFLELPTFLGGERRDTDRKSRADLLAIAKSQREIGMRAVIAMLPSEPLGSDLDLLAETGIDLISERLMQRAYIRQITERQIIERGRAGELGLAAAYCDTLMVRTGRTGIDRDELEVCEKAAAAGFPGAVRGLLKHHTYAGNTRAAEYFVGLCDAILGLRCAGVISEYYYLRSKESGELNAKWVFWDLAAGNAMSATSLFPGDVSEEELRGKTPQLRRELFQLIVRTDLMAEACGMQQLDSATGSVEANPQCSWRRPIAIPAEYLSAK
jgi:hypothetical protein